MINISTELQNYVFTKNRTGSLTKFNEITLPLTLNQCLINSNNDYQATADTLNYSLSCLHINYMYLYSKCFLIKNSFPNTFDGYTGVFGSNVPTTLTITDINPVSFVTLTTKYGSQLTFNFNRYIQTYPITINLATIINPSQLAYSYLHAITSLYQGTVFPYGEVKETATNTYTVSVTGLPGIQLNNSFTTNPNDIFCTTSTYTNNNGNVTFGTQDTTADITKFSYLSPLSAGLDDIIDIQTIYNSYLGVNVIFCASRDTIFIFNDTNGVYELVYSTNIVGYKREIDFRNITSIVLDGDFLFIGDSYYNSIYKVDVSGFIRNNPVNSDRFIVDKIIGGTGTVSDITQFNYPEPQFTYNNQLYVFDRNNKSIKIYDLNLNYIQTINFTNTIRNVPPISTVKPFNKAVYNDVFNIYYLSSYVVVDNAISYRINEIVIFDINTLQYLYSIKLTFNNIDEVLVDLVQSKINLDELYVATNNNLFKIFISNFSQIGVFSSGIFKNRRVSVINNNNVDTVYVYENLGAGFFAKFSEVDTYIDLLTNPDFQIYGLNEIQVNSNENQTFIIYNKVFKKLFYNFYKLLTNIKCRPVYVLNTGSSFDSKTFVDLEYLSNEEFAELSTLANKNCFIGENEIFSNNVINRGINCFYDKLSTALKILSNKVEVNYNTFLLNNVVTKTNQCNIKTGTPPPPPGGGNDGGGGGGGGGGNNNGGGGGNNDGGGGGNNDDGGGGGNNDDGGGGGNNDDGGGGGNNNDGGGGGNTGGGGTTGGGGNTGGGDTGGGSTTGGGTNTGNGGGMGINIGVNPGGDGGGGTGGQDTTTGNFDGPVQGILPSVYVNVVFTNSSQCEGSKIKVKLLNFYTTGFPPTGSPNDAPAAGGSGYAEFSSTNVPGKRYMLGQFAINQSLFEGIIQDLYSTDLTTLVNGTRTYCNAVFDPMTSTYNCDTGNACNVQNVNIVLGSIATTIKAQYEANESSSEPDLSLGSRSNPYVYPYNDT